MARVAVIAGDGVGKEVIPVGMDVVHAVADGIEFEPLPWGCGYYEREGRMMPEDGLETLAGFDAIYLGAIGWPTVPDHLSLWGLLLPIRKRFEQYVNVRPVRLLPGVRTPLAGRGPDDIDMLFLRENTEGEYSGTGGRVHAGTDLELAVGVPVFPPPPARPGGAHRGRGGAAPHPNPAPAPPVPLDVRACARLGAGHRGPGPGQPDRGGLERRHDARPPGPARGGAPGRAGDRRRHGCRRGSDRRPGRQGQHRGGRPGAGRGPEALRGARERRIRP